MCKMRGESISPDHTATLRKASHHKRDGRSIGGSGNWVLEKSLRGSGKRRLGLRIRMMTYEKDDDDNDNIV